MGFNDEHVGRVVFDIETAPLIGASEYIEPAEAPANYKDPEKIAAYIAEKTAESLGRCGLDVDLCRVVAISWQRDDEDSVQCSLVTTPEDEAFRLQYFWAAVADRHLIGFNCLAFDLPVLLRRSQYLGVTAPAIAIDKYRHAGVTDLALVLSFNGAVRMRGLGFYCKRFGVDIPDTLTGAGIAQAVAEDRWDDVRAHVTADVLKTSALARRLGLFAELAVL